MWPTVRPPAPQGHQYEVAYTWDNPVLYPAFLARNRIVTRASAKTTNAKNNFINGKKKFKRMLSCLFGGRWKVQVTNFPSRTSSQVVGSAANSVGTTLEFTATFGSGPEAELSRASAFCFLLSTTIVFAAVRTHFPKKNTRVCRNTVTCVARVTLNWVKVHRLNSQHLAMVRTSNMAELVPSPSFLCTTMVFAAVRTHFPKKNTLDYVNPAAINKQLIKY